MGLDETIQAFSTSIDSAHTRRAYVRDISAFAEHLGDLLTADPEDVSRALRDMHQSELARSTLRRRLSALRRFYDWMVHNERIDHNPARTCRIDLQALTREPDSSSTEAGAASSSLTKSQVETLIRATEDAGEADVRDRALLLTIVYGGLRRAEAAAMDVEHVRPLGRHSVIDLPAGEAWSSAYVKIPELVVEAIDRVQSRYGIRSGALWRSLSNRNRGDRMTPDAIYKVVQRTADRAGLPKTNVEALRQSGFRLAVQAGATLQQVQLHGRFQSIQSAERYDVTSGTSGRLQESAVDLVELDV